MQIKLYCLNNLNTNQTDFFIYIDIQTMMGNLYNKNEKKKLSIEPFKQTLDQDELISHLILCQYLFTKKIQ